MRRGAGIIRSIAFGIQACAIVVLLTACNGQMFLQSIRDTDTGTRSCLQPFGRALRTIKYCKGLVQSKTEEKKDEKKEAINRRTVSAIILHSMAIPVYDARQTVKFTWFGQTFRVSRGSDALYHTLFE